MKKDFESLVAAAGFKCRLCGECCSGPANEVLVSPSEIERLMKVTGFSREKIAEPYPEWITFPDGRSYTFGWVLKRDEDTNCIFLKEKKCQVYEDRPHLCRTYPFMLDGEELITSECPGLSSEETTPFAKQIVLDLIQRRAAEDEEFLKTEKQYQKHCNAKGSIVFDSEGVHQWNIDNL